jgi:hypothetical protein
VGRCRAVAGSRGLLHAVGKEWAASGWPDRAPGDFFFVLFLFPFSVSLLHVLSFKTISNNNCKI